MAKFQFIRFLLYKTFSTPFATQQSNQGNGISQWWTLEPGYYNWRIELFEAGIDQQYVKVAEQSIEFYVKHTLTIKNNLGSGIINIDGSVQSSGSESYKFNGENLSLGAIDQSIGNYYYVWNESGFSNSEWRIKRLNEQNFSILLNGNQRNLIYNVTQNDNGSEIQGVLKKRFNIYRNDETEFDGTISAGVVAQIVEQNSGQISAPTQQTINGHAYNFAGWSDWTNSNPKTIWPNDNETYSALYKVPQNSNQSNGFGNSSQRKFVRTPDFSE